MCVGVLASGSPAWAGRPAAVVPAAERAGGADIPSLRTRTSQTFAAGGGSYETRVSSGSVNYRDELGRWQPIDNRLRVDGGVLRNGMNRYRLTLPRELGAGAIRVAVGDAWLTLAPRGARGAVRALGSEASFRNAWPGVELRYTATGDSVREELVVARRSHIRNFVFDLGLAPGLLPVQDATGAVSVRDLTGARKLRIAPSIMIDAGGAVHEVRSVLRRAAAAWTLELVPDRTWLDAPERRWPVTIDPTVDLGGELSCNIFSEMPGAENFCADGLMIGENCPDACQFARGLVRYDLSDVMVPGAVIEAAALDLRETGDADVDVFRMTAPWTADVDWDTRDGTTPWSHVSTFPYGGGEGDYVSIGDFTALVRDWASGAQPNYGLLFKAETTNVWNTFSDIAPVLSIQYALTDDASDAAGANAVGAYAEDEGITPAEAARRLRIQDRFAALADDLEDAIAVADFGGTWIDDADAGRPKVGIKTPLPTPPASKIANAEDVLEDHDLRAEVDFVSVPFNMTELQNAADDVAADLATLVTANKVEVGVDESTSGLELVKANSLTPAEEAQVSAAIASVSPPTTVTPAGTPTLTEPFLACAGSDSTVLSCSAPFRGGIYIYAPLGDGCTGGFFTRSQTDNLPYVMTAGHCQDPVEDEWRTPNPAGGEQTIGPWHREAFVGTERDVGIIRIANGTPFAADPRPGFIFVTANDASQTSHNESYTIRRVRTRTPPRGKRICVSFAPPNVRGRHTVCGRVHRGNWPKRNGQHVLRHSIWIKTCRPENSQAHKERQGIPNGGSGGPAYSSHTAYGIVSNGSGCNYWLQHARYAQSSMNVNILPAP